MLNQQVSEHVVESLNHLSIQFGQLEIGLDYASAFVMQFGDKCSPDTVRYDVCEI